MNDRELMQQALEALDCIYSPLHVSEINKVGAAMTALRAALAEPGTCTWWQDGDSDSGVYATSCRHYFDLNDGTPEDNKMQWCCYCGKRLMQELITEGEDE
ncbi:hypothetical protein UFOVP254_16 [uncultured Caudovirales phage]|uniref:Uncharacterized protein n=1 Tax=uncultured Caudovirales phage TaxID=2100421 RepID=A0A6J5L183_9CAUD|nr:hypothetical protein UFOVP76_37 [uncultured Caudovirales phage]CAB4132921.1 hypothetical protein UFOVP254_16 [uncultured Caudovirales phage]